MMSIEDFEKVIQEEINADLTIRTNPNASDIAGVYFKEHFIGVSVPPKEIHKEVSMQRTDALGHPYKTIDFAKELIAGKLKHLQKALEEDPDLFKDED